MDYSEDDIALAAEYALGTLDADDRTRVESMMGADKDFAAIVQAWEFRLGVLNQMVGSVEPRPIVWENIKSEIGRIAAPQELLVRPDAPPPPPPPPQIAVVPDMMRRAPIVDGTNVIHLERSVKRWRNIASAVGALAAALVA